MIRRLRYLSHFISELAPSCYWSVLRWPQGRKEVIVFSSGIYGNATWYKFTKGNKFASPYPPFPFPTHPPAEEAKVVAVSAAVVAVGPAVAIVVVAVVVGVAQTVVDPCGVVTSSVMPGPVGLLHM